MAKYVLRHGCISYGLENASVGVPTKPSENPKKPTIVEMEEDEAAKINGPKETQLLPGSRDKGPCLVLLEEYEAELAAAEAARKARVDVLARGKKVKEPEESEPVAEPVGDVPPLLEKPKKPKAKKGAAK